MKFSDSLWRQISPIYHKILSHPFNQELGQGTLEERRFLFYLEQDAYYLIGFSRALAFIAARADSSKIIHPFLTFALGALVAERELHAKFLGPLCDRERIEPTPACLAYVQYLMATTAIAPLEEAVAAVLPCFWIYREVGRHIALSAYECNPYSHWIATYSSQEFSEETDRAISILDEMAAHCPPLLLARMEKAFEQSALLEWHFWDDSYSLHFKKIGNNI